MPDGKTAFDIRDYGAAEDNSAAQNAAAIQQALEVAGKSVATTSALNINAPVVGYIHGGS